MTRIALLAAIQMLPRYNRHDRWEVKGSKTIVNNKVVDSRTRKVVEKLMHERPGNNYERTEYVNPRTLKLRVLHRCLTMRSLMYLYKQNFAWQRWTKYNLPIYLRYKGQLIVWNGTHRSTLCKLANRKLRVRVIDLDAFVKKHPMRGK